jgi:ribosomal protein S18 acetylase RimI-like enzyme
VATKALGSATHLSARPYEVADETAVLDLVNADRLRGQPLTTAVMLSDALATRSPVDSGWWAELEPSRTDVVHDSSGKVLGVVSYSTRREDGAGLILWLHCREDETVAEALVEHTLASLSSPRTMYAFEFASALSLGLEGLPVRARPATRKALEAAGFSGRDVWRYIYQQLAKFSDIVGSSSYPLAEITESADPPGWQLLLRDIDGTQVAEATIGRPVDGTGVLWWISTDRAHRGHGLGRRLLEQCFDHLASNGAREVIAYVDDDAPPGDPKRDRAAANRLYDSMGFTEIDRLWSFTRPH